jgi:hypothetical protein
MPHLILLRILLIHVNRSAMCKDPQRYDQFVQNALRGFTVSGEKFVSAIDPNAPLDPTWQPPFAYTLAAIFAHLAGNSNKKELDLNAIVSSTELKFIPPQQPLEAWMNIVVQEKLQGKIVRTDRPNPWRGIVALLCFREALIVVCSATANEGIPRWCRLCC